jgi:site-specific recombinase
VSFSIASLVALRAYEVPREEQWQIVKFLAREVLDAPLSFVFPVREEVLSITPGVKEKAGAETLTAKH